LDINLIENSEIKRINRKFLGHNYFTDIITFPYSDGKSGIEGELFISLDEVKSNALLFGDSFKNEFTRVIIHGCLHLTGYNDKTRNEKELIRAKENFYMSKFCKRK
jgi:rRNA maturation RNase YbeY